MTVMKRRTGRPILLFQTMDSVIQTAYLPPSPVPCVPANHRMTIMSIVYLVAHPLYRMGSWLSLHLLDGTVYGDRKHSRKMAASAPASYRGRPGSMYLMRKMQQSLSDGTGREADGIRRDKFKVYGMYPVWSLRG